MKGFDWHADAIDRDTAVTATTATPRISDASSRSSAAKTSPLIGPSWPGSRTAGQRQWATSRMSGRDGVLRQSGCDALQPMTTSSPMSSVGAAMVIFEVEM